MGPSMRLQPSDMHRLPPGSFTHSPHTNGMHMQRCMQTQTLHMHQRGYRECTHGVGARPHETLDLSWIVQSQLKQDEWDVAPCWSSGSRPYNCVCCGCGKSKRPLVSMFPSNCTICNMAA